MEQPRVRKTFKYKLKPTPAQEQTLELVVRRCRTLYDTALEQRKVWWARGQSERATYYRPTKSRIARPEGGMRENAEINAQVLQDVLLRLDRAFQTYFRRIRAGEKVGYPRFPGAGRYHSFTYPHVGEHGGARLEGDCQVLAKIGRIKIRWSRPIEGAPKTVTISREADGWYVSFSCAEVPTQPLPRTGHETGIDRGSEAFATLSNGTRIFHPGWRRRAERALKTAQRRVSRRKKGSARRRKAITLLAKAHQRLRRQRQDFHHETALELVRQFDTIYDEDLQTANMIKRHHLAKRIADAGWASFLSSLACKAAYAGKQAVAAPPAFTSQVCTGCGALVQKGLSLRWHACPDCGISLHRDHNAARNKERAGQVHRGTAA
jgi:putative transposase